MRLPRIIRLDVTYRKADEMKELENHVKELELKIERLNVDMHRFSFYAAQNLQLLDDLQYARKIMEQAGLDTSFIRSGPLYKVES